MSARVICFASAKGGSGKTVITATIGSFLAALGKRVLLIDTDAATNGLTLLISRKYWRRGRSAHLINNLWSGSLRGTKRP